ncbi:MAG: hypothetical protein ACTHJ8_02030 [Mucilaginibacter sp.]
MADYNIIYTSPDNKPYLWNGSSFDLLSTNENEKLLFSGKSYDDKEVNGAAEKAREAAKRQFPEDTNIRLHQVEVPVNGKSDAPGHTPHILS